MPKRSNSFQNLFHVIYKQRPGDATVTESKMLRDKVTGEEREVDIVIQSQIKGHLFTVGVECIGQKRPACTEWIERMQGKHQNLPTDKLILVSQSGFYKSAIKKAQFYRIETLSLGRAMRMDWTRIAGKTECLYFEYYENRATYSLCLKRGDGQIEIWAPPNDWVVFFEDGTEATINDVVNTVVASGPVREEVFRILDAGGGPKICIRYTRENSWFILDKEFEKHELAQLLITLETTKEITPVPLTHGTFDHHQVAFGEGSYSKGKISLVALESEGEPGISAIKWPTGELQISQMVDNHGPQEAQGAQATLRVRRI